MSRALPLASLAFCWVLMGCAGAPSASPPEDDAEAAEQAVASTTTDAEIQTEIADAAAGLLYSSESDYPYAFVSATLAPSDGTTMTEALVRTKLASFVDGDPDADKPLSALVGMKRSFASWKARFADCPEDMDLDCKKARHLNYVLQKHLRGTKAFYFGRSGTPGNVQGVAVSILIVGRAPSGNLIGVRTLAIWT